MQYFLPLDCGVQDGGSFWCQTPAQITVFNHKRKVRFIFTGLSAVTADDGKKRSLTSLHTAAFEGKNTIFFII
jgi:hypothetical protein